MSSIEAIQESPHISNGVSLKEYYGAMPEPVRNNIMLRRKIWPRMNIHNENWMCCCVGETGSGKSYAAVRLGEALDPNFSIDNIAFSVEEFLELVNDDSFGPGSVFVLEEAGVAAGNRNWWDIANEVLDSLTQTWRNQNKGAVFTAPDFDLIDSHVRRRFHHLVDMVDKDEDEMVSKARFKYIQTNHETGKTYRKFYRMVDDRGIRRMYRYVQFGLPSPELIESYEDVKSGYTDDLNASLLEKVRAESAEEDDDLSPHEIVDQIISEDRVEDYISESPGGEYLDRDLLKVDFGVSEAESKQVKKLLVREADLDVQ
ncbi:hypothetical protein [Haloprofundus halobius]|uniref:hypothetical protein n=1 Tax=Haloprofundus halobius TaxID=2876194 RepID=UPI001CCC4AE0|nr:hypothetical protein [Haloprofundus halobius]